MASAWDKAWNLAWGSAWGTVTTPPGVEVDNTEATAPTSSGYNICDRTGFRALPHELVTDPYSKNKVLKRFADDHQWQENIRSRGNSPQRGPRSPENDDVFISGGVLLTADGLGFILYAEGGAVDIND